MKSIITLATLIMMVCPSFAAPTKKAPTKATHKPTTIRTASENTDHYSDHSSSSHDGIHWLAGLGLGTVAEKFHFGTTIHGLVSVSKITEGEILVGGETGFIYGPSSPSTWIIPIMVEGQFNFKGNAKITPYAGLSMGVGVFHSDGVSVTVLGTTISSGSATSTKFAMLAKGGLFFGSEGKYYAELSLGTAASSFALFPTVGMRF